MEDPRGQRELTIPEYQNARPDPLLCSGNSERPRILFVSNNVHLGGPSHSLLLLLNDLRKRYHTAVLLPQRGPLSTELEHRDIPYYVIPRLHSRTIFEIYRLILRERFDLIYGNDEGSFERNAILAGKLARKPCVWHFRSIKWHWGWKKGLFLLCPDDVIAVSRACADSLKRFRPFKEVHVVHNGVELESFARRDRQETSDLARELGLPAGARIIISVSHLNPRKGHKRALEVMAGVLEQEPAAHLLIVGSQDRDPDYTEQVRILSRRYGIEDHIHILGLRPDVARLLQGSELFLHMAMRDPHPRAVLEAMATGLPVVAFSIDGVAETVLQDQTGHLLPAGDLRGVTESVLSLLRMPEQAGRMGQRGREHIQNHFTAAETSWRVARRIDRLVSICRKRGH